MVEKFALALSEKTQEDAAREVSLKIKSIFPKSIKYILLFFTPQYKPSLLLKTLNFTLNPKMVLGIQAPLLIFENRIIEKGVIALCINKKEAFLKEIFTKKYSPQDIEASLRKGLKQFDRDKQFLLSTIPQQCSPSDYLQSLTLSLGKAFNVLGVGFLKKYASKNYLIINNSVDEGLLNIIGSGLKLTFLKIGGFIPLGKPFIITRVISERNIIMEINGEPAINIYKHYFEEKFEAFTLNNLFPLYPFGIKEKDKTNILIIKECLEDGSLVCMGEIKENTKVHLMLLHPPSLLDALQEQLTPLKNIAESLIFMINSLPRKKILRDSATEEIKTIHDILGKSHKIFGIYSDYSFFPDKDLQKNIMETGNLILTLWE
ncbi:MAG: FIST C-terminal domain-containing protein [Candidatus Omnitrophota bacterium]|nr:FIST C-terminal domain-containing protein [Candidatus Omnitrophota bacterium]